MDLQTLNIKYAKLSPEDRIYALFTDFPQEEIVFTSSFGTTAAILLQLISSINPKQKVIFLDTTYHFIETITYRDQLASQLKLNIETVLPEAWKNDFTQKDKTWTNDPDLCCSINKVEPMDRIKEGKKVWISGLLAYQNSFRKNLDIFEEKDKLLKIYPIIDMTEQEVADFFSKHKLPKHPLESKGYSSIGCAQCTVKGQGRSGRWSNLNKTECGLHQ